MKRLLLALILLASWNMPPAVRAAGNALRAVTTDGRASVRFPRPFQATERTRSTLVGDVTTAVYRSADDRAVFGMSVTKLPGMAITFAGRGGIMAEARDTILKDYDVADDEQDYSETTFCEREARKLVYDSHTAPEPLRDVHGEAVFFFIDDTLVTLNAAYASGDEELARQARAFFESFAIEKKLAGK